MKTPIEIICELANCSEEEATLSYSQTNSVFQSVDDLLEKKKVIDIRKCRVTSKTIKNDTDKKLEEVRELMKKVDENISTSLSQRALSEQDGQTNLLAETVPQNSYSQQYQTASRESVVEKPETVCQLQFECSYDLLLNGQT